MQRGESADARADDRAEHGGNRAVAIPAVELISRADFDDTGLAVSNQPLTRPSQYSSHTLRGSVSRLLRVPGVLIA